MIAFDWQGTLDIHPELLALAQHLQATDIEVTILSAMPVTMQGVREAEIEKADPKIPYIVVYHELENYHQAAGKQKVKWMKEHGYSILIDDNDEVIKEVRNSGLLALQV